MPVNFFPEGSEGGGGVVGDYIPLDQKGVASGVATLDSTGKVPQSQLPNISITDTYVVASEAEMLALTAQKGDVAVRTDTNQTFILQNPPATTLGNWVELGSPSEAPVISVDGMIGAVSLTNTYQPLSNELTGLSTLTDTPGFIKKISEGIYAIDTNTYLTTTLANTTYQPLHANLTSISGITTGTGLLEKTAGGWQLSTVAYQPLHAHLTSISNLTGDGYLEKVGTSWFLRSGGPFQPLDADLTAIAALTADGTLIKSGGIWSMSADRYQPLNNELSGFSALPDTVGLVTKTGDGTYVLDTNTYLTTTLASTTYQPLNANLTGISGLVGVSGVPKLTDGVWSLDATGYLTQNEVITLSGDVTGSGRTAITTTLATIGAGGTFPKITYNTKGLVTGGSVLVANDIPALDWSKITTGKPTTVAGYGITDAYTKTEVDTALATKQPLNNELTALSALADTAGLVRKTGDGTYTIDSSVSFTVAGDGLTSTGNTINAVGTAGRIVTSVDAIDLALAGTAGTYPKVTTDDYGRVISGTTLVASDIPGIDASKIISGVIANERLVGTYSYMTTLIRDVNNSALFLKGGDATAGSGAFIHLYGKDYLAGQAFIDSLILHFRSLDGSIPYGSLNANGLSINPSTPSTSTTTGAVVVAGGVGVQGKIYADTVNAIMHLRRLTNANRPAPSEANIGMMWANAETGNIEVVVNATEIKAIAWQ